MTMYSVTYQKFMLRVPHTFALLYNFFLHRACTIDILSPIQHSLEWSLALLRQEGIELGVNCLKFPAQRMTRQTKSRQPELGVTRTLPRLPKIYPAQLRDHQYALSASL